MLAIFHDTTNVDPRAIRARFNRAHVYAAGSLIASISEVMTVGQCDSLLTFLRERLGESYGLVIIARVRHLGASDRLKGCFSILEPKSGRCLWDAQRNQL